MCPSPSGTLICHQLDYCTAPLLMQQARRTYFVVAQNSINVNPTTSVALAFCTTPSKRSSANNRPSVLPTDTRFRLWKAPLPFGLSSLIVLVEPSDAPVAIDLATLLPSHGRQSSSSALSCCAWQSPSLDHHQVRLVVLRRFARLLWPMLIMSSVARSSSGGGMTSFETMSVTCNNTLEFAVVSSCRILRKCRAPPSPS